MHIFGPGKGFFLCATPLQKRNGFLQRSGQLGTTKKSRGVIHGNKIMELFWTTVMTLLDAAPCVCLGPLFSM